MTPIVGQFLFRQDILSKTSWTSLLSQLKIRAVAVNSYVLHIAIKGSGASVKAQLTCWFLGMATY